MNHEATKTFWFSAAHRIEGHAKCGRLHGHNYRVDVTVTETMGSSLDAYGFVLDFGVISRIVKPILEEWDHRYMVSNANVAASCPYFEAADRVDDAVFIDIAQTSAELLAQYLNIRIGHLMMAEGIGNAYVKEVRVWETPKAFAVSR